MQFNTLQDLWNYCVYCPVCRQNDRTMHVSVGPDTVVDLYYWLYEKGTLLMQCHYHHNTMIYSVEYLIDCLGNTFDVKVSDAKLANGFNAAVREYKKVERAYFFFYIQSSCENCQSASCYGTDIEMDMLGRKITNIGVERETLAISNDQDSFLLSILYDSQTMLVSRLSQNPCENIAMANDKVIQLPLANMDLSNTDKVISKIKTLILFS
jgi:hypothetical protein